MTQACRSQAAGLRAKRDGADRLFRNDNRHSDLMPCQYLCLQGTQKTCCKHKNKVHKMLHALLADEAGFIVSAELVLIATILVIGLIVGLSEVQHAVVSELNDVSEAIGCLNQSYSYTGFSKEKSFAAGQFAAFTRGSAKADELDDCDLSSCDIACDAPVAEGPKTP